MAGGFANAKNGICVSSFWFSILLDGQLFSVLPIRKIQPTYSNRNRKGPYLEHKYHHQRLIDRAYITSRYNIDDIST